MDDYIGRKITWLERFVVHFSLFYLSHKMVRKLKGCFSYCFQVEIPSISLVQHKFLLSQVNIIIVENMVLVFFKFSFQNYELTLQVKFD